MCVCVCVCVCGADMTVTIYILYTQYRVLPFMMDTQFSIIMNTSDLYIQAL